jgi:FkbH-like protein
LDASPSVIHLAIAATFTAEPLAPVFDFWSRKLETPFEVCFAPYNQVLQTLLDPASVFGRNPRGLNVVLVRWADLSNAEQQWTEIVDTAGRRASQLSAPLLLLLTKGAPAQAPHDEKIERIYPVKDWESPEGERLGRIPYSELYFAALGTGIVRDAHARYRPPFKVIALDCDNTLWSGICGEDGPEGVLLDKPRRALQQFMLTQREAGMLLAIASKNNEPDVVETFERHPEFPLSLNHFSGRRIDWEPKPANLSALASSLGLGQDSFIFVDDNPRECAEVREALPDVLALTLPTDPARIPQFLDHVWAFDHPSVTREDHLRSASYAQTQEFGSAAGKAADLDEFYRTLELRLDIRPLTTASLARAAQLTQRTNQFNFTTIRRTEADLQALMASSRLHCHTVTVADRFGDYGLTGLVILEEGPDALGVDTLLLSCRVLGRGVEHQLLRWLGNMAGRHGYVEVHVPLLFTARNIPAREFLETVGGQFRAEHPAGIVFDLPVEYLEQLEFKPAQVRPPAALPPPVRSTSALRRPPYGRIARDLASPQQILEAIRAERRGSPDSPPARPPASETELALAGIWRELLRRPAVEPGDNFFDLGGHSLLAVLLLVRIKESFGIELPVDEVYSGDLTLERLAQVVDGQRAAGLSPAELHALIAEIEALSEEEVRAILDREEPAEELR